MSEFRTYYVEAFFLGDHFPRKINEGLFWHEAVKEAKATAAIVRTCVWARVVDSEGSEKPRVYRRYTYEERVQMHKDADADPPTPSPSDLDPSLLAFLPEEEEEDR